MSIKQSSEFPCSQREEGKEWVTQFPMFSSGNGPAGHFKVNEGKKTEPMTLPCGFMGFLMGIDLRCSEQRNESDHKKREVRLRNHLTVA